MSGVSAGAVGIISVEIVFNIVAVFVFSAFVCIGSAVTIGVFIKIVGHTVFIGIERALVDGWDAVSVIVVIENVGRAVAIAVLGIRRVAGLGGIRDTIVVAIV